MVSQQHIGMYGAAVSGGGLAQFVEVARAVDGREEAGAAIVAALHELLRHAGQVDAWLSWRDVEEVLIKGPCSMPTRAWSQVLDALGVGEPLSLRHQSRRSNRDMEESLSLRAAWKVRSARGLSRRS